MNTMNRRAMLQVALALGSSLPITVMARENPIYTGFLSKQAVSGYDPVAYFVVGKPVKGDAKFQAEYGGAVWHFSSAANREAFLAKPERYAPQYGGYCAWAVATGKTASGDPRYWKIVDGKLYLNYSADIQKTWEADIGGHILRADGNWPAVLGK